jgi:hypothetical protein
MLVSLRLSDRSRICSYPGITNKIFDGLICRDLGEFSVLDVDYSVNCEVTYWQRQFFNGSLVILCVPHELPAIPVPFAAAPQAELLSLLRLSASHVLPIDEQVADRPTCWTFLDALSQA